MEVCDLEHGSYRFKEKTLKTKTSKWIKNNRFCRPALMFILNIVKCPSTHTLVSDYIPHNSFGFPLQRSCCFPLFTLVPCFFLSFSKKDEYVESNSLISFFFFPLCPHVSESFFSTFLFFAAEQTNWSPASILSLLVFKYIHASASDCTGSFDSLLIICLSPLTKGHNGY